MDSKEVLGKMFSSFLDRKNRSPTARAHFGSHEPPLTSRSFHNASASNMPFVLHEHIKPPFQSPHIQNIVSADHSKSFPRQRGEKRSHASKSGSSRSEDEKHPNSDNNEWMAQKSRREKTGSRMSSSVRDNSGAGSNSKSLQKHAAERQRAGPSNRVESSVIPGRRSSESVDAIAVDSTSVPTPFHCEKCSKAFRQRSQLSRHFLRVHERKKPFACAHCDKSFASAFDRKRHVEAVHGRRCIEFFCDRCSFRSKLQPELEKHIRETHERDQCRLCGKIFKRPANLVAHERHYHSKAI